VEAASKQRPSAAPSTRKALTIGAVAKILSREFDDVSISKIRYLEDQKLLSPRRTPGGYRLYSQSDVERLQTILRLQRDEFLPLRVIRQELASRGRQTPRASAAAARRAASIDARGAGQLGLEELVEQTGVSEQLIGELEEFRIVQPQMVDGHKLYDEADREIVSAASELSRFGVEGRNLRVLRSSADREAALLEQVVGPALRSQNPSRRKEAIENLEALAATCGQLTHLLLVRDLRQLTGQQ
jgi:DNA-binding transcriptional MerR regulator